MWWLVAVVAVALNLRPAVASVSPLLDTITRSLRLSATAAGLLTTLPVVCMGLFAPVASVLAARVGVNRALALSVSLIAVGTAVRGVGRVVGLYGGSVAAGIGIAVAGALLPGLVKARFPANVGPVTGVYTAGLIGGALLAAAATEPLRVAWGWGWAGALAAWAVPAVLALAVWLWVTRVAPPPRMAARAGVAVGLDLPDGVADGDTAGRSPWRERRAWLVTLYMGGQSLLFYASLAWLAARYTSIGMDAATAGLLLGVFSATQLVSALVLPLLAHRTGNLRPWIAGSVSLCTVSLVLVALVPLASPWTWAALLGLGMGGQFALALTLIAEFAPAPELAAAYSGMAFFVGYLLAAAGPVAAGLLRDLTGGYEVSFLAVAGVGVLTVILGIAAARPPSAIGPP